MRRFDRGITPWALGFCALLGGCGATWPAVIDPSDIADLREARPHISRVRDLGAVHIGQAGPLLAESDGQFAIGEMVLIEGSGFGKQPTLTIGGRPAEVRWRTQGGGIVTQIPAGSAVGAQTVSVQSGGGQAAVPLQLSRLAVLLDGRRGQLQALRVARGGATPTAEAVGSPLTIPGAQALALSYDGAAAYVLLQGAPQAASSVAIVDLVAPGGPRIAETRQLRHPAQLLVAAERAGVLAMIGTESAQLTLWDIREARRPAPWQPAALPASVKQARAAALHPDGQLLALALPEDNQIVVLDVKPGLTAVVPRQVAALSALPGMRQPLVHAHGLRFSSDGSTLWLSSGDNADSQTAGHQPTRITAMELKLPEAGLGSGAEAGLEVLKTLDLRDAGAPLSLALARTPPVSAGTAIRTPPEKATVFLTTTKSASGSASAAGLWRSDLQGHITPLYSGKELLAGLDVSPDAKLAVTARVGSGAAGRSLAVTDLETSADVKVPLGASDESDLAAPFDRLQLLLQP